MKRILIVEDEMDIAESVKSILEDEGYEATVATDGKEAIDILPTIPLPQLILSDLMMPRMDGMEFLKVLKKENAYKNIPVILMSAGNPGNDNKDWDAFIKKPFNIDDLLDLVETKVSEA
jgi:CheY-like chemotaxis protein